MSYGQYVDGFESLSTGVGHEIRYEMESITSIATNGISLPMLVNIFRLFLMVAYEMLGILSNY